jgi:hypothetical protein
VPAYGLTLTAHAVACIPCGRDYTGMPFGIQVCGRRWRDRRTRAIAAALERFLQGIPELAQCPNSGRLTTQPATQGQAPAAAAVSIAGASLPYFLKSSLLCFTNWDIIRQVAQ